MNKYITLFFALVLSISTYGQGFSAIWNTSNTDNSSTLDNQIEIPTNSIYTYNYTVDWGDGNIDSNVTGNITHTYASPGSYTINISGTFPQIYFNNSGDHLKIEEILSWGNIQWLSMENSFWGCLNLNFDAIDAPNLSQVTTLRNMFRNCVAFNGIVNHWNITTINDLSGMFADAITFNRPLDNWNVSAVTNMSETFYDARNFNEPLDSWNTASVTDMSNMFNAASDFNQNIDNWSVNQVTTMFRMFANTTSFNSPLNSWNVANVTDMSEMFEDARIFNQPLNDWNVSNVTNMTRMFDDAEDFNQPLDLWNVANVTLMDQMFSEATDFNQPIGNWDVSSVTSMISMFERAQNFNQPLNSWDVSNVTNMHGMFDGNFASTSFNQPLDAWNTVNVTDMSEMFRRCDFNQPIGNWNVENVTNMSSMFSYAPNFNQPIESWNVESVENMISMFFQTPLFNQPLNNWTTTALTNISGMFSNATQFNQNLDNWNVSNVTTMNNTFNNASAFNQNLAAWNISNVNNMQSMLSNSNLSLENYDLTLISWASQSVQNNVSLGANTLTYCDGLDERQDLIDNHNWSITGDSVDCSFVICTQIISPINGDLNVPANSNIIWDPAPNATGYYVSIRREDDFGNIIQTIYDNEDVGNVVSVTFTNEFLPGDNVYVTVIPYNDEGPAVGCEEIYFKTVESWVNSPDAFKLTYDTQLQQNSHTTPINQLKMQVQNGFTYNYSIDWGDGQYDNNVSEEIIHTYLNPGIYTVSIIGDFPAPRHEEFHSDSFKLISIDQWGTQIWESMEGAFAGCSNMEYAATDIPNLSIVTDMSRMFIVCQNFNGNINDWDVSNVTNMYGMFAVADIFNQPLNNWDISNVTNLSFMFYRTDTFNQDINGWNTANVTTTYRMFETAIAFNQPLDNWNVANVITMENMFKGATAFNQPLNSWDLSSVTSTKEMFENADAFNSNISSWNVENVNDMESMFYSADAFNQPIDGWNVGNVIDMQQMFSYAASFNQPLISWDVSSVNTMYRMFANASSFNQPLNTWNVSSVTNMSGMFANATVFNQNINSWNVTNVLTTSSMFENAIAFNEPLDQWDVNSVVDMSSMFEGATLFNQPIGNWDVSAVASMSSMFQEAVSFNQTLNDWDVSSVTLTDAMFKEATLFNNPLNDWDVASITNMMSMFEDAIAFDQPLDNWDTGEVLNMQAMFKGATLFNRTIDSWDVSFVTTMEEMFRGATTYNQSMNSWNVASVTTMEGMFEDAISFNSEINSWNVRGVTTMQNMFYGATSFNQTLNNWRVTGVQNMTNMFRDAVAYNQSMSEWNIGNVTMTSMFRNASAFNQNLVDWDMSNVINVVDMLDDSGLNRENYDATLIAWSELTLTSGLTLGADSLLYCDALQERQSIIDNFGWTINGDILDCPIPECTQLILPLHGDTNVPVNTNLTWEDVLFASGYTLEITIQPSGTVINETLGDVTAYEFVNDFTGGETVYVTIIPFNDNGNAIGPCTEESFTISSDPAAIPACTNLTLPIDGATEVDVDTDISWTPIANADGYRITAITNPGGIIILSNEDVGNVSTYNFTTQLPEETLIDVTITPYNEEGNANSCTTESFTTQTIPTAPVCTNLSNPVNNANNVAVDTDVTWNAVADATGYLISIGTTSGGIEVANSIDVGNMTTYDIPYDLDNSRTYYVTIIPYNAVGDATGCNEEIFITEDPISTSPTCTNLLSPINGATNIDTTLNQITWSAATNATAYRLTISGTANNNITDFETTDTFYNFVNPFVNSEVVTVSIVPFNTTETALGCASESFTIIPETPNCTQLISPLNNETDVATTLSQISWNPVSNATAYRLTISGTANNDITDFETTDTFYNFVNPFLNDEVVSVTIVPINATVDAIGCTSESFTIIPETPNCTQLISPAHNDTDVATTLNQISWNAVPNATAYRLTISGTANNDITDFETTDTFYNFANPFMNSEVVTVTIITIDGTVEATGCASESFTIIPETPNCTQLISPLNNETDVATTLSQISWNPVSNATAYRLTISGTANNNVTDFETTDTFYTIPNPFLNDEVVSVTIVPINVTVDAIGCTSESFTIIPETPNCTQLISPAHNDTDVATTLSQITWNAVPNATAYRLTISGTANNDITDFETTDTFYNFANPFMNSEVVTVTIITIDGTVEATGCASESFTIIPETPNCTQLISPLNNETDVATTLSQISWNSVSNATAYRLTISGTANNDITDFETTDTFYTISNPFLNDEVVSVTIVPINVTVDAIGCTSESFTIIPETPNCTQLISPLNNDTDVATTLSQITWNAVPNATAYRLTISGTANNNVTDFETTDTFYNFANPFVNSEVVTVTIITIDGTVEATGCASESFTIIPETPNCTQLISPLNNETDVATTLSQISWNLVSNATAYRLTISGTANNNVTDFETTDTFYTIPNPFLNDEVVSVTIVPINVTVDAIGCTSESFTIIPETPNCTQLISPAHNDTDVATTLSQITWNAVPNATAYRLTISGTANNDITDFETTDTFYNFVNPFETNEVVSITIKPINGTVEAIGCTTESFSIVKTPLCTELLSPFNGETDVEVNSTIEWEDIFNADGYFLSIGTISGGTDILNNIDVGATTTYNFDDDLESLTTYYVTITPYNLNGVAESCYESTFTTLKIPKNDVKYGFSPNGDGVNDFWNIVGIEDHPNNTVSIFNRWGDLVFEINNYNNTTNVFRGIANRKTKMGAGNLPDGTYFFQFSISGEHNFKTLKGYVIIKR
ncbi:BspA family leucine-rich repeat surface protein [Winogradskyella eckloniae]|uniref:BspA family leucine-rich repeat surface protein n=1 Tax=Winogradskyella eckloniae TaxID=1089306 RepID=UPI0015638AE5|nr:BspA family leucine-rich repeat surface protein [Winogradskyella eckloniae]NRD21352.1 BspA family leucine-rich repeat surface protein [Winogradskyella eckloniae]